jgi:coenzyme F420-dependent glucose-6-phosphate dehydrogenase
VACDSQLRIAFHASHEQFKPSELLAWAQEAEKHGFESLFSSDHFHPWSHAQGQAGFSWAWMGAALALTQLPGGLVCCPAYRYHPAVIAQAAATLAEMFPRRFWLAVGSGQALNEQITGGPWPTKDRRNATLLEAVEVIRALWAGETVTHRGLVTCEGAKLYTLPASNPLLFGAAVTEQTAEWVGSWADGLITTSRPPGDLKRMVEAFRAGGGEGKPMALKVGLSYARTEDQAKRNAFEQWRTACFPNEILTELRSPLQFEAAAQHVRIDDVNTSLRSSSELRQHQEWLAADAALGFEELILHNVGTNQSEFIHDFGAYVLPSLR